VLLGHANVIITLSDIMVGPHGPLVYAWWFLAAFWHQAVLAFFVISGFLVGGPLLARRGRTEAYLKPFLIDRFSRIYIVMIPTLVWSFGVDFLGRKLFPETGIYDSPVFQGAFEPIEYLWTLLQQQHIWAFQAGTNGPLWSLACEMWYYVTFPLLLLPFANAYSKPLRQAGGALGALLVAAMATPEVCKLAGVDLGPVGRAPTIVNGAPMFLYGYGVWALGAAVRVAPRALLKNVRVSLGLFVATLVVVRLAVRGPLVEAHPLLATFGDSAVVMAFANLLLTLRFAPAGGLFSNLGPIHARLSDFSYSLYATHAPLVFFAWAAVGGIFGRDWFKQLPTPTHWAVALGLVAAAVAFAYAFSRATEARTKELRDFLRARLIQAAPA
jgi:peptidoglycan/LPS O-acetylase OafA/YrhL